MGQGASLPVLSDIGQGDSLPVLREVPHGGWVDAVAFSPNGEFLATGCRDGKLRVFEVQQETEPNAPQKGQIESG